MTRHRLRFVPAFLALGSLCVVTSTIWLVVTWDHGRVSAWMVAGVAAIIVGVAACVSLIGAWVMWRFMDTAISANGIRGWTIYNTRRWIRWDEIEDGCVGKMPLLPFASIRSVRGGPSIWQPLLLSDRGRFVDAVAASAREEHALTRFLRARA